MLESRRRVLDILCQFVSLIRRIDKICDDYRKRSIDRGSSYIYEGHFD